MAYEKQWWKTDAAGRKIGYMYPEDFEALLAAHYDDKGWVRLFSEDFDISQPTIYRYRDGFTPIPKSVVCNVMMLVQLKERGIARHLPEADWLPNRADLKIADNAKVSEAA